MVVAHQARLVGSHYGNTVLLILLLGGSWLCQHPKCTSSQSPNSRTISIPSYEAPYPRRSSHFRTCHSSTNRYRSEPNRNPSFCQNIESETLDTDIILDRLLLSFRNRSALRSDPPSYHSVVKYHRSSETALYGPPPSYSIIIKKTINDDNTENNTVKEGSTNDCTAPSTNNVQTSEENTAQRTENTSSNNSNAFNENIINVEIHRCDNEEGKTDETPKGTNS